VSVSRPALRPTQPPVQWVPGVLSLREKCGRGVKLTTHSHLVPRSRVSRSYTSSPPWSLHRVAGQLYLFTYNSTVHFVEIIQFPTYINMVFMCNTSSKDEVVYLILKRNFEQKCRPNYCTINATIAL
jgi:hypothetical protein